MKPNRKKMFDPFSGFMRHFHTNDFCKIVGICLATALSPLTVAQTRPTTNQSSPKWTGTILNVRPLEDGSVVMLTSKMLYIAPTFPEQWDALLSLPANSLHLEAGLELRVVGGSRKRIYLAALDPKTFDVDQLNLEAYTAEKGVTVVGRISGQPCVFFDELLGAKSDGSKIQISRDGASSWNEPFQSLPAMETVTCLNWIGDKNLLVGGSKGTICYLSLDEKGVASFKWRAQTDAPGVRDIAVSGNQVWFAGDDALSRVDLSNGNLVKFAAKGIATRGILTHSNRLFCWDPEKLEIWSLDGANPENIKSIDGSFNSVIGGKFRRPWLVARNGDFLQWDERDAAPKSIQLEINMANVNPEIAKISDFPSQAEVDEMMKNGDKLPNDVRAKIRSQAAELTALSPRERTQWMLEEYKKAAASRPATAPTTGKE